MSKCSVSLVKKSSLKKMAATGAKAANQAAVIADNQDNTATVMGVDAAGAPVDISSVATLTATSDNPLVLTVDAPTGSTFAFHGLAPGTCNINITATWNDGSIGPFNLVLPATVTSGPATGIQVDLGTPTSR